MTVLLRFKAATVFYFQLKIGYGVKRSVYLEEIGKLVAESKVKRNNGNDGKMQLSRGVVSCRPDRHLPGSNLTTA